MFGHLLLYFALAFLVADPKTQQPDLQFRCTLSIAAVAHHHTFDVTSAAPLALPPSSVFTCKVQSAQNHDLATFRLHFDNTRLCVRHTSAATAEKCFPVTDQRQELTVILRDHHTVTDFNVTSLPYEYVIQTVIPTIARPKGISYLNRVLTTWCKQMLLRQRADQWRITVYNFDPANLRIQSTNPITNRADSYGSEKAPITAEIPSECAGMVNVVVRDNGIRPGEGKTQKQTRDVLFMLADNEPEDFDYFVFAEDDFEVCEHSLDKIERSVRIVPESFSEIYFSVGLNGVLLQKQDLPHLSEYLEWRRHVIDPSGIHKQADHAIQEWVLKEKPKGQQYLRDRRNFTYRHNLFRHIGAVSSLQHFHSASRFYCGETLNEANHFPGIAFDDVNCPNAELSPCALLDLSASRKRPKRTTATTTKLRTDRRRWMLWFVVVVAAGLFILQFIRRNRRKVL